MGIHEINGCLHELKVTFHLYASYHQLWWTVAAKSWWVYFSVFALQRQSVPHVLRAMVDGACHWIKAGLPLKCLKLVLYSSNPSKLDEQHELSMKFFKRLKSAWTQQEKENVRIINLEEMLASKMSRFWKFWKGDYIAVQGCHLVLESPLGCQCSRQGFV